MRNRQTIEREMYRAREDLEESLAELKHVVQEKVDVKARARVAVAKGKLKAQEALEVGKARAQEALEVGKTKAQEAFEVGKTKAQAALVRGRDGAADAYAAAKERPALVGAIAGGVIAVGALVYIGRQRDWW
jgi:hypothetical protein